MTEQRPTWEPRLIVIELEDPITPLQAARNALEEDTSKICHLEPRMRAALNEYIKDLETENDTLVKALERVMPKKHKDWCRQAMGMVDACPCGLSNAQAALKAAKREQLENRPA